MTDVLRITGFLMMVIGGLLVASWFVEPLRQLWPLLLDLPLPIRIGLGVAGAGLLVVLATVVHDRINADPDSLREHTGTDDGDP
ncbi:hypothetical protein [Halomonas denitrificans]|nr:hypothetical protein [Halomonas denitrificans]